MKLKIEKLVFEGFGLGHSDDGKTVFVKKSVPDDELEIDIIKEKKNFREGIIKKVIKPSSLRIAPKCPHFDRCGGCEHQNIAYANQLRIKEEIFKETLNRAGVDTKVEQIIPGSAEEFYYRNVIRFFFIQDQKGEISFAMHDYVDFNKLIPVDACLLQSEKCNEILSKIKNLLNNSGDDEVEGWIKNKKILDSLWQLRIREGKQTGDFMIELITKTENLPMKTELVDLLKQFPEIKSAYHCFSTDKNLRNTKRRLLFGSPIIYEKIGKFTFQISPESFFQTNSCGVKNLYDKIKEFADIKIGDSVLDLFCGTGTIGIYFSILAKKILGVEISQSSVNDAVANARINHVANTEFICADATKWLRDNTDTKFNTIIVDPPRQGLDKNLIYEISNLTFDNLIYVSCDPATFARDIKELEKLNLKLKKVQPIDMFPQTHHIECVGLISK